MPRGPRILGGDSRSRRLKGANNNQWEGAVKVIKVATIEKAGARLPYNCGRSETPANHCPLCASPRTGWEVFSHTCTTRSGTIRLAVSFGLALVTYKPSWGSCPAVGRVDAMEGAGCGSHVGTR